MALRCLHLPLLFSRGSAPSLPCASHAIWIRGHLFCPVRSFAAVKSQKLQPQKKAGYKLEAAIEQLGVDVEGKVALDSGLSTGGFTDCLLQNGASFVYGVDVGYGQVADKIRRDERVSVIERTNLRYLPGLPQKVDLVTLDLSFISLLLVMPAVVNVMKEEATLVTLVKPQFEARRSQVKVSINRVVFSIQ
ncbi:hypothetical protein BT93_K0065 [Corymbia citriodora subsp. variegata]|nr:hypothetical protein BT93_K0065 [Corymbia citriodora subsp. variegata]